VKGGKVASQGQRFRRRALRRGYKVDEVDSFLDRVEATLNGEQAGSPVTAQEVHDVVFRVRFGGYDEWQVDLHLDRVERQLGEVEERGGFGRAPERPAPPERMPAPPMREDRMMPPPVREERPLPPPVRDDRMMPPPMPARPVSPMTAPASAGFGRFDEPTRYDEPARFDEPNRYDEPTRYDEPNRYDEPTNAFGVAGGSFDGFEPGRHGKTDMTTEIRMPADLGRDMGGPPPGEAQRIDQLRRTFQPRRFGSGYDPGQVDRLFEGLIAAMTGRSPVPINDAELDPGQFSLVPGGYFEAEVDQALREVRDIIRRR
jgi:DivIVA domain-containing protein